MWQDDKLHEECGVFGVYNRNGFDTSRMLYYGLFSLQHRGQESAGIAVNNKGTILYRKETGMVSEIFDEYILEYLQGQSGIGHVRYSTSGDNLTEKAQPLVVKYTKGQMALAYNGNLTNVNKLRRELEGMGTIFQTGTDLEVIAVLLSRARIKYSSMEDALKEVMGVIEGAYSILIMTPHKLIAARDPLGMRPLVLGKKEGSTFFSSESCSFDALDVEFVRDVKPGEIIVTDSEGVRSIQVDTPKKSAMCIFEYVYFARPDSVMEGIEVFSTRFKAGQTLAKELPLEADIVVGVPDSGLGAAQGYAYEAGIPFVSGFMKNRYVGRTFIQPKQDMREIGVQLKLNPIRSLVKGKIVVLVDDSIVRGTTSRYIVGLLKKAGAKEVHLRISSPPVRYSCHFGIDTPERNKLVASANSIEEIQDMTGADSLGYISMEGLLKTCEGTKCDFCTACFLGNYPVKLIDQEEKECQ